jgi:glycosyltransferase involved in cell wall biosynthesis
MNSLKITILTPSYNQGSFIEKNIEAVLNQNYSNFEHIILDGGSSDNTVEVLKKYPHLIWISEKDEGQADCLNKGLKLATGDIIGWINSDDYIEPNIFETINEEFSKNSDLNWIVGNLNVDDLNNNTITKIDSPKISYEELLKNPDIVKQPATFIRKRIIEQVGGWNKNLYMVMDYDLWIRISKICNPKKIDKTFANFVVHPNQKTNPKNSLRQIQEIKKIVLSEKKKDKAYYSLLYRKYKSYYKKKIKNMLNL